MARRETIRCDCGGSLSRPIPPVCPHCGRAIAGVHKSWGPLLLRVLFFVAIFAVLLGYLAWLLRR